jgi:hypothetical protein
MVSKPHRTVAPLRYAMCHVFGFTGECSIFAMIEHEKREEKMKTKNPQ